MDYRLVNVVDTTSGKDTTIKIARVSQDEEIKDIILHQIQGTYDSLEDFDREWETKPKDEHTEVVNFISVDIPDARKITNALIELLKR